MRRALRPLAVIGAAAGVSLAVAVQLAMSGAHGSDRNDASQRSFSGAYDLARLSIVDSTLYHVEESYVEPSRIDWEHMFVAALEAVETTIPGCMFTREVGGDVVSVEIGEFRTVREVALVQGRVALLEALRDIAQLLVAHLDPADVPEPSGGGDPFAQVEYAITNGLLSTLDPHSVLMPPEDSREMDMENRGGFGGLGVEIESQAQRLTIHAVKTDNPADRAGLRAGDVILRIDGESTLNMRLEDAVHLLRGAEGEAVILEVDRDSFATPREFKVVRARIKLNEVHGRLLEGGVGYVRIESFHQEVEADLAALLARLAREAGGRKRGLVLDLRHNPGGYLNQAVAVADRFLERGTVVTTVDGAGRMIDVDEATANGTEPPYPIAVLVDSNSASASEIVAGALRNNDRALVIGSRTFGKGSVQNLHSFYDGSKLKLTISKYLTPGDKSIQSVGIPADIELVRTLVQPPREGSEATRLRLFSHERARREVDLEQHLERMEFRSVEAAYSLRFLAESSQSRRKRDLEDDYQVGFARDVLLATRSGRRTDALVSAEAVVRRHAAVEEGRIETALGGVEVDWSSGPTVAGDELPVEVALTVRSGVGERATHGALVAGEEGEVTVTVTNRSQQVLHRLVVVARDEGVLDGREFVFGRLEPGEVASWDHKVTLMTGAAGEHLPVTFEVRDGTEATLGKVQERLEIRGADLPRLAWRWAFVDGDGDGVASIDEDLVLRLTVENEGEGPTVEPFARIRNLSGVALEIGVGVLEPGEMQTAAGTPCPVLEPGVESGRVVGDPALAPRRVERKLPPRYERGCRRVIQPGEQWSGDFELSLRGAEQAEPTTLELTVGDLDAFDHATVYEAGFYEYLEQSEEIALRVDTALPEATWRRPPSVTVSRAPGPTTEQARVTLSGVVRDDNGIHHVMVFSGRDKIFYEGSGRDSRLRSVPFTADAPLTEGRNVLSVQVADVDGQTRTASVVTWFHGEAVARAP